MRIPTTRSITMFWIALSLAGCGGAGERIDSSAVATATRARRFRFDHELEVRDVPATARELRVWVPLPSSDEAQTITGLGVESAVEAREARRTVESVWGNRFAYFEFAAPFPESIPISVSFEVERREVSEVSGFPGVSGEAQLTGGDRRAPLTEEVRARAATASGAGSTTLDAARGIYDRVLEDVAYDKSGTGWGQGDVEYVCREGKGNCSDFHTLFIAMSRTRSIPALFEIGFPLPAERGEGEIGGYHCWAWFRADESSWRPVDASEADKRPQEADYFFGTLCENRVAFTRGRDLVLEPRQAGEPVNFLVYPYIELDGVAGGVTVEKTFRFRDLDSE